MTSPNIETLVEEVKAAALLAGLERARQIAREHNLTNGLHRMILRDAGLLKKEQA